MNLTPTACRVLGSLLEKELTVPSTYPMTTNGLISACNQTTGRDPVMTVNEAEVTDAVNELRDAGLARLVHASHGARTTKVRQVTDEALVLDVPGRSVLGVLLLRGPQTSGELRARTDRLHPFAAVDEVERTLGRLAERADPLVVHLPRRSGHKERRWAHTLSGDVSAGVTAGPGVVGPTAAPETGVPSEIAADVPAELAPFVGSWVGAGAGSYPTIDAFGYTEQIEIRPVPDKPMVAYRSATRARDDGRTLHGESGFLRVTGDGTVELVVAQGSGLVEVAEGLSEVAGDRGELVLSSTALAGTSTAKSVTATERRYQVDGDVLTYDLAMAAVGQPLSPHLHATLRRGG